MAVYLVGFLLVVTLLVGLVVVRFHRKQIASLRKQLARRHATVHQLVAVSPEDEERGRRVNH